MNKFEKIRWISTILIFSILLMPNKIYAKNSNFKGWNEEKKEEAWTVYVTTDWSKYQNELILDRPDPETSTLKISNKVEEYRDLVARVLRESDSGKLVVAPEQYVNIMLAMMQVLSDGNPDESDPCMVKKYFDPDGHYTAYSSIEYLFSKLITSFRWHNNFNEGYSSSIYKVDAELQAVLQTIMYGAAYRTTKEYSTDHSLKFYEDNKDSLLEHADPYFADKVVSHYRSSTLSGDYTYNGTITNQMELAAEYGRINNSTYPCTANWCAAWVQGVYENVGLDLYGNAIDMWNWYKDVYPSSTDMSNIPPGAYVCGSGVGYMGSLYGHVGIYIGNGLVANNIGYHSIEPLSSWISWQTANCQGNVGWIGWILPFDIE